MSPRGGRREGAGAKPGTTKGRPAMPGAGRPYRKLTLELGSRHLVNHLYDDGFVMPKMMTVIEVTKDNAILEGGGEKIVISR